MKKVLLFPGAFNPPHIGHSVLVQTAVDQYNFDEVWIMPSGKRDDGKVISISYEHRRNLNILFTEYLRTFFTIPIVLITTELDDTEDLGTKEHIRRIKETPNIDVVQLIGSDAYGSLLIHNLIVPSEKFFVFKRKDDQTLYQPREGDHFFDIELPSISSTMIRTLVQEGNAHYKDLVTEKVAMYIESNKLYSRED